MRNKSMQRKLDSGKAIDVSACARDEAGNYILPPGFFKEGKDYCDATTEEWIWSIGRTPDGVIRAATNGAMYESPMCECIWLR